MEGSSLLSTDFWEICRRDASLGADGKAEASPTKKGGPQAALLHFRSRQESFALKLSPSACRRG
jgi:hypothetical protein